MPIEVDRDKSIYVYQPTVKEIVETGEEEFGEMTLPFLITMDSLFGLMKDVEELYEKYDVLDFFFLVADEDGNTVIDKMYAQGKSIDILVKSLKYFLRVDDIKILNNRRKLIINDSYLIDSKEFGKIRKAIQAVTMREDIKIEKPPENMSDRQRDIWLKLQSGRKKKAEKSVVYVQDIINFVSYGGASYISIEEVLKMTYFELQNAYKSILNMDAYKQKMAFKLSDKFDYKDKFDHWTSDLKIGK